ncbi:hypothetical protein J2Z65_004273 [Paenibacillus aceris]|uniref:Uncharacterized protein n=1 Tax=Paenibacillus aceris TaxID=869555 RepID=A0ABS4I2J8_9BACL|nr:hypothetical protein [Paenibacillus aceris]
MTHALAEAAKSLRSAAWANNWHEIAEWRQALEKKRSRCCEGRYYRWIASAIYRRRPL